MADSDNRDDTAAGDPRELLRKIMQISPEDAEEVRRDSPATPARTRRKNAGGGQDGPTADYGDVS